MLVMCALSLVSPLLLCGEFFMVTKRPVSFHISSHYKRNLRFDICLLTSLGIETLGPLTKVRTELGHNIWSSCWNLRPIFVERVSAWYFVKCPHNWLHIFLLSIALLCRRLIAAFRAQPHVRLLFDACRQRVN